jgi:hypothetical protein
MKKILLFVFSTILFITTFAQSKNQNSHFTMKVGKYRQLFYLPQAQPYAGVYKIDTFAESAGVYVAVIGGRESDALRVLVSDKAGKIIMQQFFFMDGSMAEDRAINSWFVNYKKIDLNKFLLNYFGITIKSRQKFIKEYRTTLEKAAILGGLSI